MPELKCLIQCPHLSVTCYAAQVAIDIDSGSSSRSSGDSPTEAKCGKGVVNAKSAGPEASEDLKAISGKSGQQADRGMVLPFEPLAMSFSHMWYSVTMPAGMEPGPDATKDGGKPRLHLLKDVSGAFRPGVLTALVGESGAGKTTLMVRPFAHKCKLITSTAY
jgi:ABC-type multidrug transport system fused ATPase/permease subunit